MKTNKASKTEIKPILNTFDGQIGVDRQLKFKTNLLAVLALITILLFGLPACKKLTEVAAPSSQINSSTVFTTDATAIAAVTSMYITLANNAANGGNITSMSLLGGLSADEFQLYVGNNDATEKAYYENDLSSNNSFIGPGFWSNIYPSIYQANAAIEGITSSTTLTPQIKEQLLGEALFTRALLYFYLVNLYGDVPLVLTSNYKVNSISPRTPVNEIYAQIIVDLKSAETKLNDNFVDATLLGTTTERVRPTKWAAYALLARTYLYTKDYQNAIVQASFVINNSTLFGLTALDRVFLKNSNEAIWQLQPVASGQNTWDGATFIVPQSGPTASVGIPVSDALLNAFEAGDQRKSVWIDSVTANGSTFYFPFKYKKPSDPAIISGDNLTEYEMVLRLGEQYLIRAEAEANLNELTQATNDLNLIRARAGLAGYLGPQTSTGLLDAIYRERRIELFSEWGHRWLDLKRTGQVDAVMGAGGASVAKGGTWAATKQVYPIPLSEIKADPNLIQNPGY